MSMEEEEIIKQAMTILGRKKSSKKAEASRANGKLGGRPKKQSRDDADITSK